MAIEWCSGFQHGHRGSTNWGQGFPHQSWVWCKNILEVLFQPSPMASINCCTQRSWPRLAHKLSPTFLSKQICNFSNFHLLVGFFVAVPPFGPDIDYYVINYYVNTFDFGFKAQPFGFEEWFHFEHWNLRLFLCLMYNTVPESWI